MSYFTQFWDEGRDDEYSSWGNSTWYFETNDADEILKYSAEKPEDEFGKLAEHTLTIEDCDGSVIEKDDFYNLWK